MANFLTRLAIISLTLLRMATAQETLGTYNVDTHSISVSGFSAGGFMAAQLGIAYSDLFKTGFGVFAGGPYDCARDQYVCLFIIAKN